MNGTTLETTSPQTTTPVVGPIGQVPTPSRRKTPLGEGVYRATTREELEAVYRFRYQIYFEEYGRLLGTPDHERQMVTDADDELPTTTILYTGTPEKVTGTVRLRHWQPGEVPQHDVEELSIDRFPGHESLAHGEIGRLMVRRSLRGQRIIAALLRASYLIFAGEQGTDLAFCYCSPALVRYYQHLAMRPFGGRLVPAPDGMMIPMVSVLSDVDYYRSTGSLLAGEVASYFGPGRRPVLDMAPFRHLFAEGNTGIELEPRRIRRQLEATVLETSGHPGDEHSELLSSLPDTALDQLLDEAMILDVETDFLVTRQGFRERELFVVVEGAVAPVERRAEGEHLLGILDRGELFGQDSFLDPDGRRQLSYRTLRASRLLVLRGRSMEKLIRRHAVLAEAVLHTLHRVMAAHTRAQVVAT